MDFVPARKEQSWLKMLVTGLPGAGKTWGALRLGAELANLENGKMVVIDTENGSSQLYADRFSFDIGKITGDYHPAKFIDGITSAVKAGYKVLVIDSGTHEWEGVLSLKDSIEATSNNRNKFAAWAEPKRLHSQFVDFLQRAPIHVIVTSRVKPDYQQVENDKGFMTISKIGTKVKQNDEFDYEFGLVAQVEQGTHTATIEKSRYACVANDSTVNDLATLANDLHGWLKDGVTPEPPPESTVTFTEAEIPEPTPPATPKAETLPAGQLTSDEVKQQVDGKATDDPVTDIGSQPFNDKRTELYNILKPMFNNKVPAVADFVSTLEKDGTIHNGKNNDAENIHNVNQVIETVISVWFYRVKQLDVSDLTNVTDYLLENGGYTEQGVESIHAFITAKLQKPSTNATKSPSEISWIADRVTRYQKPSGKFQLDWVSGNEQYTTDYTPQYSTTLGVKPAALDKGHDFVAVKPTVHALKMDSSKMATFPYQISNIVMATPEPTTS